jgi:tight adherence protein B
MSLVDLVTLSAFGVMLMMGTMLIIVQDMRKKQPKARISTRMGELFTISKVVTPNRNETNAELFRLEKESHPLMRWVRPKLDRLRTVAGTKGVKIVVGATVVALIVALLMVYIMPLPGFVKTLLPFALPVYACNRAYVFLVNRFRQKFLDGFPDLIDLLVRAVRAGVPVTQVIVSASEEVEEPLKTEFKLMGDALQVGLDLEEVLDSASRRIEVADFSFFCVCLMLQRETGGQLGETLENLAGIVRTRREIRQKTRALTGEARITTKILAAIPPLIMLAMYAINPTYIALLFGTPSGQNLLTYAVISVVFGVVVITKMSKLDTSR